MRLELSREEAELLAAVLQNELSDLRFEIADTDSFDFRETLKHKRVSLEQLLERITATRQTV